MKRRGSLNFDHMGEVGVEEIRTSLASISLHPQKAHRWGVIPYSVIAFFF